VTFWTNDTKGRILYGTTRGVLQTLKGTGLDCGVICTGWPSFGLGLLYRGWSIKYICIQESDWSKHIWLGFPSSHVLKYDDRNCWSSCLKEVKVWFCDTAPYWKMNLWDSDAASIITRQKAREVDSANWSMTWSSIAHPDCGGVTDGPGNSMSTHPRSRDSRFPCSPPPQAKTWFP